MAVPFDPAELRNLTPEQRRDERRGTRVILCIAVI